MTRLTITLALLTFSAFAQTSRFEGKRIENIQYLPAQILDPDDLAKVQPLKTGEPLRADEVAAAIDGLFATGRYEDISVEAEESPGGVIVRFVTKPARFVSGVMIEGKLATPPNRGELTSGGQFT